jgi:hypothetical protein
MIWNERGIALPMALLVMVILTALMTAVVVLATSEPQIASNHLASTQARALAESGVERVLWALTAGQNGGAAPNAIILTGGASNCTPYCLPAALSPYDGGTEIPLGVGSFKVTITEIPGPVWQANKKLITAVGFVPNATTPIAIKKIQVTATRLKWIDPVCALCAGGENPTGTTTDVQVGGNATVNSTTAAHGTSPAGQFCSNVTPIAAVASNGTVNLNGSPNLYAKDPLPPPAPPTMTGAAATKNNESFPSTSILTDSDFATLKALAQANGTYYKGSQTFNHSNWPPNGIIVVDTVDGSVLSNSTPSSNIPTVEFHGTGGGQNPETFSGWVIVAGSISIQGNVSMAGLVYAQNDLSLNGTGNGIIQGAAISTNRVDASSTNIDSSDTGQAPLSYNCPNVRNGGGFLSQNWFMMPGTYREKSGS